MSEALRESIIAVGKEAAYDMAAKKVLSQPEILARILKGTINDFKCLSPKEIEQRIIGDISIEETPISPGLTNTLNTEDSEINEGVVKYDILFSIRDGEVESKIIINIEVQNKSTHSIGYYLLNRAIYYGSRLISSQKGVEFQKDNYDDIKRIYSIWICVNVGECCMDHIHLIDDKITGSKVWKGNLDLFNIILIGLPKDLNSVTEDKEVFKLLTMLFDKTLSTSDRLKKLENEFNIDVSSDLHKEVSDMGGLGMALKEEYLEEGREEGEKRGIEKGVREVAKSMILSGYTDNQIVQLTKIDEEKIQEMRVELEQEQTVEDRSSVTEDLVSEFNELRATLNN